MIQRGSVRSASAGTQALWNLRWPALYLCGPLVGVVLVDVFFGLPGRLWLLAGGFFMFSLLLFGILMRGETRRLRAATARQRQE